MEQELLVDVYKRQDVSQVKEIEKMQKQFFSDISHELKTPMSAIIGSVEILQKEGIQNKETFDEFMGILLKESYRMQNIIEDILELSRLEQPRVTSVSYTHLDVYKRQQYPLNRVISLWEAEHNEMSAVSENKTLIQNETIILKRECRSKDFLTTKISRLFKKRNP